MGPQRAGEIRSPGPARAIAQSRTVDDLATVWAGQAVGAVVAVAARVLGVGKVILVVAVGVLVDVQDDSDGVVDIGHLAV
jgi:hypothetical protein